jgi:hypothetical protein
MSGPYAVLAGRIRQDVAELERVVARVERAVSARRHSVADPDFALDSAALNLHDVYAGLERVFTQIASVVDRSVPSGPDWHRALLRQMTIAVSGVRPQVLFPDMARDLDELLRFRHVVRNVYAFDLDPERIERLADRLPPLWRDVREALIGFATFLDGLANGA